MVYQESIVQKVMKTASIILEELCVLIGKYTRLSREQINPNIPFLEMGADSMILVRAIREIEKVYGVKITIRALYEKYNNLSALAKYIVENSTQEAPIQAEPEIKHIPEREVPKVIAAPVPEKPVAVEMPVERTEKAVPAVKEAPVKKKEKVSWQTAKPETKLRDYSSDQQQHLEALTRRYNRKTQKSKILTQKYRANLADSKATVGFRMSVKEMLYPIIGAKTEGSRLWDIDGNEYIDITMGFGAHMFGYRPDFIMEALKKYVDEGTQLGPRSAMIGETAKMICDITGFERVAFANTGTEANMAVLRIIRAATGKSRIAMFRDSYHGHSDYTLAEGQFELEDGTLISVTPGIPQSVLPEVLVLDYGDPAALDKIMEHRHELAGVIVEPVQSRNPLFQPVEFLRSLRELTLRLDIPLVFDEMITGFRCHPGGAQGYFGIQADIATYGKAIGGGLPIGIIAGKAKYLDGIDGGFWSYGDQSFPQTERTFFGGTFCQHPMVIPVANAVLKHLNEQGPELQKQLSQKMERMAKTLNTYFEENKIPIRISYFASVFRFELTGNLDLFYYHMIERGVYIWEWRLCFLTTAHTEEDVDFIIQAAKESAEDLRRGGFLPEDTPAPKNLVYHPSEEIKYLTEEQKQLWVISQIGMNGEGASAYNVIFSLKIEGDFYYNVMKNALQKITDRYEVLRSTIDVERVVQKIHMTFKSELQVVDLTSYNAKKQKEAVDKWIIEYNKQAFDLSAKPAFEAVVLKLSPREHILILKAHHMFVDGISLGIILEELAEIYSAGCEIRTPELLESVNALPYDEEEENARKSNLSYWIDRFKTPVPACNLPYDYQRPQSRIHSGADKQIFLEESLYKKLIAIALQNNVSLYMVLFSLFTSFIQRISGSDEIVVAMPTSGRYTEESERLMGHYAAILPIRTGVDSECSFTEQLKKTAADLMEAFEYQNFSFPELCERVKSQWPELVSVSKFPLTSVLFNYDKMAHTPDFSDAQTSIYISSVVNYVDKDIFFNFIETQNQLVLDCQYSTDLFAAETINRMLESLVAYMKDAVDDPKKKIKELEIVTEKEKKQILEDFNSEIMPYLRSRKEEQSPSKSTITKGKKDNAARNVVERFYQQAHKTPDNTAIIWNDGAMTYQQFNKRTNQIARMLKENGVKQESIVAIVMERSPEMLLAIMGILKSGGAYLPIDPGYPEDRIEYMLENSGAQVLITQKNFETMVEKNGAKSIKTIVINSEEAMQYDDSDLDEEIYGHDLAYIIYTSGSTGKPKGAMVEHKSLYNTLEYTYAKRPVCENDTVLLRGPYSFDGTVLEIFIWIFNSAKLVILEPGAEKDPLRILEMIQKYSVTHIVFVPSMLNVFLDAAEEQECHALKSLKYIIVGGEALSTATVNKFHKLTDATELVNIYGPTEVTVYSTDYVLDRKKVQQNIPIGTPVANIGAYILDKSLNLVPIGVAGELCLSGIGLSRGYINNPELTSERFVDNPFLPGEKMYKTGDITKWRPDGTIEYLGRNDDQVKVRGFRIELGEIEAKILQHSAVKETVVRALEDTNGMKYLCAYLSADKEISLNELRAHLSSELPEYMIPSYFIFMERMPKNLNDKIDRARLPEPSSMISDKSAPCQAYNSPENETEKKIAGIWRDLLGHEKFGVEDNFLEIGGHSLKATMMMMRLRKEFNINISLNEIFNNPTIRGLACYIESLAHDTYEDIVSVEGEENYAVSASQKRMYILNKMAPGGLEYNITFGIKITGNLDKDKMEKVFNMLIQRHESFRTSFDIVDGEPVQRICAHAPFHLEALHCKNEEEMQYAINHFAKPFDLGKAPLIRAGIIEGDTDHQVLVMDMHHIIFDGVSTEILFKEMIELYKGRALPAIKTQYKDFAAWQNDYLKTESVKRQEQYWLDVLSGELPVLDLPMDYQRPEVQSFEGDRFVFKTDSALAAGLKKVAAESGSTLYMVLLAAYNILLSKYSGQDDIVVGSPIAGRHHADVQDVVGMFVNTMVMRNQPKGHLKFSDFLRNVRINALNAYENQEYQFEELVEKVRTNRDPSRNPIFDTLFVLQSLDVKIVSFDGLSFETFEPEYKIAKFDLSLSAWELDDVLCLEFEYCIKLFKKSTVERFLKHYLNILKQICDGNDPKISQIQIISKDEEQKILEDFNDTTAIMSSNKSLLDVFCKQAAKTPDATALVFKDEKMTYGELDKKSDQVARMLIENGVTRGNIVGIMVNRSFEMLLGIIGIWKAGCAYLPIDPAYPVERVEYMLEDSGVRLLLIKKEAKEKVYKNSAGDIPTLILDNDTLMCSEEKLAVDINPHDLAVVIYTSGSTGNPKGAIIEHGSIFNTLDYSQTQYPVGKNDAFILNASYSFDGSILELFGSFLGGGKLVILEPGLEKEPLRILEVMEKNNVTHVFFAPSMLNVFLEAAGDGKSPAMKGLKYVYAGGEVLGINIVNKFHRLTHEAVLVNIYGPTETSIYATCYTLDRREEVRKVPIGKPISNMRTYILDKDLHIVPIGVAGELYLSGAGLARGYINKPELTTERFIENPYEAGERMYKTGDRVRWMGDGNIEYLGRTDYQVKVRGFRIELGEIEVKLLQHENIKEAVVKVWEDNSGMKSLCAYISADGELTANSVRTYLSGGFPEYMIPSEFVFMDIMPKTANGKVDRAKLLKPSEDMTVHTDYVAPETPIEKKLAAIWQELLGHEKIGVHDNFFEIGGHSLKATIMMLSLKREFDVNISLNEIFNRPRIYDLARYIERLDNDAYLSIKLVEEKEYYEVSAGQKRMYILNKMMPDGVEYNVPIAFNIIGELDIERMSKAINALVRRHESLRTSFDQIDGQPVQRIHKDAKVEIEFSHCDNEEDAKNTVKRFIRPFDLSKAPLMRVGLIEENKDQYLMVIDMPHIIVDGVSSEILFKEMIDLYMDRILPSKKVQYKDFAAWQNEYLKTEIVKKQEKYWLDKLKGELPLLELPTDYPRPFVQSFEGSSVRLKVDRETTAGLKKISAENGATLYMTLLAAYNILLSKFSNQEDLLIGTPIAGRQHADVQQVVGMFVNTLVMRNQPLGHLTFNEFLGKVKTTALEAYENQEYQFEELVEKVSIDRNPGRNPIFDTVFVFQSIDLKDIESEELTFKIAEGENKIAKFDLTLVSWEKDDELYFDLGYCTSLFKQSTIEKLLEYYQNMLRQIGGGKDPRICEVDGLPVDEKTKILEKFHGNRPASYKYQSLQAVIYAQAAKTPGNTALIQKNEQMNYQEFNKKSNQIARMLMQQGVTRGSIVGIQAERSFEMLLGIMGILKAGGAYLPLDPQYPAERIEYMLDDSGACLLLTQKDLGERSYKTAAAIPAIILDSKEKLPYEDGDVVIESDPKDLAYIIYTSGSTGKPKGVMIEHGAILNSLEYLQKQYPVEENDTVLLNISYCFDGSIPELFGWFFAGGRLALLEPGIEKDPFGMLAAIDEYAVTHMLLVPSMLNVLLNAMEQKNIGAMQTIKYVYAGGEALESYIVDKFYQQIAKAILVNLYGPTEASVFATDYVLEKVRDTAIIPIGKPIPNMGAYILDRHMNPVPIGVKGELCLSGAGLAREYIGNPDLTAEKFVESPFVQGERIYRTGDQARWMPDGNIEYIGRIDDQIKLRGFRIELGEIERTLRLYSDVKDAVVTVWEDPAAGKTLVAYLTTYGNKEMDMEDIRSHMEKWLPAYMVPGSFVLLENMPLMLSGKVDKKALPRPDSAIISGKEYMAPQTELEQKLVDIIEDILNIKGVGMNDNFFHVGGNSLYILQLLSGIEDAFEVELSVIDIMETPVLTELSRKIEAALCA